MEDLYVMSIILRNDVQNPYIPLCRCVPSRTAAFQCNNCRRMRSLACFKQHLKTSWSIDSCVSTLTCIMECRSIAVTARADGDLIVRLLWPTAGSSTGFLYTVRAPVADILWRSDKASGSSGSIHLITGLVSGRIIPKQWGFWAHGATT